MFCVTQCPCESYTGAEPNSNSRIRRGCPAQTNSSSSSSARLCQGLASAWVRTVALRTVQCTHLMCGGANEPAACGRVAVAVSRWATPLYNLVAVAARVVTVRQRHWLHHHGLSPHEPVGRRHAMRSALPARASSYDPCRAATLIPSRRSRRGVDFAQVLREGR